MDAPSLPILAAPLPPIASGAAFASPRSYAPGPVACGGGGLNSRGPQNARHPRGEISGKSKRVRGRYELAFRSHPHFLGVNLRELRPNGVLRSS